MAPPNTSPTGGTGWRNLRTGILFFFGLLLAAWLGLFIGKNTGILSRHDKALLFVPDIKGLTEGNMVSISGKKVGTVDNMTLVQRNDTSGVLIELKIRSEYFGLITKDSKATIRAIGVLGDKYIDITLGRSREMLSDGGFLDAGIAPGLEELTESALKTMDSFEEMSAKINRGEGTIGKLISSDELSTKLLKTASNLEAATNKITTGKGLAARLVNDEELSARVSAMVTDLSDLSGSLKAGKGSLGKLMVDESFYNHLHSIAERSDSLLNRLNNPQGSIGKLSRDARLYDNLNQTIISLDSLLRDLKQNPGRYVKVSLF